ncbi:MAG: capsular polysaccharide synthesis protein [Synergistaceae bacterium]|nr:capsular polysaccharide synthesis protein [Synergistaceae bacterium]
MGLINSIEKRVKIFKNFGFKVGMADLLAANIFPPSLRLHDKIKLAWLKENFAYVIEKYKYKNFEPDASQLKALKAIEPAPIWVMWLQGEEAMPEIVKACYASIKANCANHPVKLITSENLRDYVNLPEHIFNLLNAGKMTRNAFANLCRLYLIYTYGGLWLDATIFVTSPISDEFFNLPFFTIKYHVNANHRNVSLGRWTTFLLASQAGNILPQFVLEFMSEYWRVKDLLIDYALFDYSIATAYNELPECRNLINAVPKSNHDLRKLNGLLNSEFNQDKFNELTSSTQFFKLTYKQKFNKIINNHKTFYAHILELYN